MLKLTLKQLINCGVHIGHSLKFTLLFSSWMLYGYRQNLWLINVVKSIYMFRYVYILIKFLVKCYYPIWFINLDKSMEYYIKAAAIMCGEFWCCNFWIKGLVSNFKVVKEHLYTEYFFNKVVKEINLIFEFFFLTRRSWPRALFVSNVYRSDVVVKEAVDINIPCIGIIDTNVKSNGVSLAIPGNDDSILSIIFYNKFISELILFNKFFYIVLWYWNIRRKRKVVSLNNLKKMLNFSFFSYFSFLVKLDKIMVNNNFSFLFNKFFYIKSKFISLRVYFYCSRFKKNVFLFIKPKRVRKVLRGKSIFKTLKKNKWKDIKNLNFMKKYAYKKKGYIWGDLILKYIFFKYIVKFYRFKLKNKNISKLDNLHYLFLWRNYNTITKILIKWKLKLWKH